MTVFLGNAFSLNMLNIGTDGLRVDVQPVQVVDIPANAKSIIGHADLAALVSGVLKRDVQLNRESVTLQEDDVLFVIQYRGPRLPAGTTELPAEANIEFLRITFHSR